jgi:hypothetical protein
MIQKSTHSTLAVLIVLVVILGISVFSIVTFRSVGREIRDVSRGVTAVRLSQALERYYHQNGEYPSVASLVNAIPGNTIQLVASRLSLSPTQLRMPQMSDTNANIITAGPEPTVDAIVYIAESDDDNDQCQNNPASGCARFRLQYKEESGQIKTIRSRHNTKTSPRGTAVHTISPPSSPAVIALPWDGTAITFDWDNVACPIGMSAEYLREWSREGYASGALDPVTTTGYTIYTNLQGFEYSIKVQARCVNDHTSTDWSAPEIVRVTTPIKAPKAPVELNVHTPADQDSVSWTWKTPSCGAGLRAVSTGQVLAFPSSSGNIDNAIEINEFGQSLGDPETSSYSIATSRIQSGHSVVMKVRYTCINEVTGRIGDAGPFGISPEFVVS